MNTKLFEPYVQKVENDFLFELRPEKDIEKIRFLLKKKDYLELKKIFLSTLGAEKLFFGKKNNLLKDFSTDEIENFIEFLFLDSTREKRLFPDLISAFFGFISSKESSLSKKEEKQKFREIKNLLIFKKLLVLEILKEIFIRSEKRFSDERLLLIQALEKIDFSLFGKSISSVNVLELIDQIDREYFRQFLTEAIDLRKKIQRLKDLIERKEYLKLFFEFFISTDLMKIRSDLLKLEKSSTKIEIDHENFDYLNSDKFSADSFSFSLREEEISLLRKKSFKIKTTIAVDLEIDYENEDFSFEIKNLEEKLINLEIEKKLSASIRKVETLLRSFDRIERIDFRLMRPRSKNPINSIYESVISLSVKDLESFFFSALMNFVFDRRLFEIVFSKHSKALRDSNKSKDSFKRIFVDSKISCFRFVEEFLPLLSSKKPSARRFKSNSSLVFLYRLLFSFSFLSLRNSSEADLFFLRKKEPFEFDHFFTYVFRKKLLIDEKTLKTFLKKIFLDLERMRKDLKLEEKLSSNVFSFVIMNCPSYSQSAVKNFDNFLKSLINETLIYSLSKNKFDIIEVLFSKKIDQRLRLEISSFFDQFENEKRILLFERLLKLISKEKFRNLFSISDTETKMIDLVLLKKFKLDSLFDSEAKLLISKAVNEAKKIDSKTFFEIFFSKRDENSSKENKKYFRNV